LYFIGFGALQTCVVSASAVLWLMSILDGALARRGLFLQSLSREKPRVAFRVSADAQWLSGGEFQGSTRKNLTRIDWIKGAPVTDQCYALQSRSPVFPIGCDAPRSDLSWSALCVAQRVGEVLSQGLLHGCGVPSVGASEPSANDESFDLAFAQHGRRAAHSESPSYAVPKHAGGRRRARQPFCSRRKLYCPSIMIHQCIRSRGRILLFPIYDQKI
jgi:hypothetical protein